jgi:hypothetical protein
MGWWLLGQGPETEVFDPRYLLVDPAAPNEVQFSQVTSPWTNLLIAASRTPEAIAGWFAGPDRIDVPLPDGASTTIDQQLWDFIHQPGLDEATAAAALLAVWSAAQGDPPLPWQTQLLADAAALPQALQEETRLWEEANPMWKRVLHTLLDVAGLFFDPVDLAHGGWYAAEGDWGDAAWSAVSLIPALGMIPEVPKVLNGLGAILGLSKITRVIIDVSKHIPSVDDFVKAAGRITATGIDGAAIRGLTDMATVNPKSDFAVLGTYRAPTKPDWASSYEQVGHAAGGTYFNMGQAYDKLYADLAAKMGDKGAREEMWRINQQFLDDQIDQGKTLWFTVDPENVPVESGTWREWAYIQDRLGGNVTLEQVGEYWAVVPK